MPDRSHSSAIKS